jgi:uncharacterized protein (DUF2267 family)
MDRQRQALERSKAMSMTGLDIFDNTIQKTNLWLKDMMEELGWEDRHKVYQGLRVTLHALRDRLTVEEAVQLAAQLPLLVRGVYYEGWRPTGKPHKERHLEEFLAPIWAHFRNDPRVDPEAVARAVFKVLAASITAGELEDIQHMLPKELNTLWPTGVR